MPRKPVNEVKSTPDLHASPSICADIDGVPIERLVAEHGSPLYVFSEATLRRTYRTISRTFQTHYPDVRFAWSYKTNYLKAICAVLHHEGAGAEVVSDFEYEKARSLGVKGHDVIFNGPYKQRFALERAVDDGAKIQIDHERELWTLAAVAQQRQRTIDIAVRVYLPVGTSSSWSKFGFDAGSDEVIEAIRWIRNSGRLRLVGLHTHVGTSVREPAIYAMATERLIELAEIAHREGSAPIEYLNLGGGFAASNAWLDDASAEATAAYAQAIGRTILDRWPKNRALPRLYLETGRAIVDPSGYFITTIVARKCRQNRDESPDDCPAPRMNYSVDSGIHLLPPTASNRFRVRATRAAAGPTSFCRLLGCLCMNTDVLCESVLLPEMEVGDRFVLHPVGAYHLTQSMQFIQYRPRAVMITEAGNVEVIRERENLEHLEALERLPPALRLMN